MTATQLLESIPPSSAFVGEGEQAGLRLMTAQLIGRYASAIASGEAHAPVFEDGSDAQAVVGTALEAARYLAEQALVRKVAGLTPVHPASEAIRAKAMHPRGEGPEVTILPQEKDQVDDIRVIQETETQFRLPRSFTAQELLVVLHAAAHHCDVAYQRAAGLELSEAVQVSMQAEREARFVAHGWQVAGFDMHEAAFRAQPLTVVVQ